MRRAGGVAAVRFVLLRDRIARALPHGADAVTGQQVSEESSQAVRDGLGIFTKVLLVFAMLYAEIAAPTDDALDAADTVRQIMRSVRDVFLRHPNTVSLIAKHPPRTLDALAFVEAGHRALRRAGIDPQATARGYRTLAAYSIGTAKVEINGYFRQAPTATASADSLDAPTLVRHLPHVAQIGPLLGAHDDTEEFDAGLNLRPRRDHPTVRHSARLTL